LSKAGSHEEETLLGLVTKLYCHKTDFDQHVQTWLEQNGGCKKYWRLVGQSPCVAKYGLSFKAMFVDLSFRLFVNLWLFALVKWLFLHYSFCIIEFPLLLKTCHFLFLNIF